MIDEKSYTDDQRLSSEFNALIQDVTKDVMDSTALKTLENTTATLRNELPHLEETVKRLNNEANSLKAVNRDFGKVNFNELTKETMKINKSLTSIEERLVSIEKDQKALKSYQNNILADLKKSLDSYTRDIKTQIKDQNKDLQNNINLAVSKIDRNFSIGFIGFGIVIIILWLYYGGYI